MTDAEVEELRRLLNRVVEARTACDIAREAADAARERAAEADRAVFQASQAVHEWTAARTLRRGPVHREDEA